LGIDYSNFKKAVASLDEVFQLPVDSISRDESIQRCGFCVELSWESAKKYMGTDLVSPKQVVREMARAELIEDVGLRLQA